jgi:hypothetical protein
MVFRTEFEMAGAVAAHFTKSAREVKVGDCIFDVVAYDKKERLFRIIECKLGSHVTTIGRAFGQISAYIAILSDLERERKFIDAFTKKVPLRYERLMQATQENTQLRVAFYVALTDSACEKTNLIRSLKRLLPSVGIIRVKPDGKCREYLRCNGKRDTKLSEAIPTIIEIMAQRCNAA